MIPRRRFLTVAASACGFAGGARSCRAASPPMARDRLFCLSNGRRLLGREFGPEWGQPAFYFHGMPGSRLEPGLIEDEVWEEGVRLVALDRPGIGGSDYQHDRQVLDWPNDVRAIAHGLGWDQFGVIGLSGGAPFALACAAAMPGSVAAVALVSGHAPFDQPCVADGNQDQLVRLVNRVPRLGAVALSVLRRKLCHDPDAAMETLTSGWTTADRRLVFCSPDDRDAFLANLRQAFCQPSGLADDIGLLAKPWCVNFNAAARHARIVIWQGACDGIAPPSHGRYFHRNLPGSCLVLDPHASHVTTVKRHVREIMAHVAGRT